MSKVVLSTNLTGDQALRFLDFKKYPVVVNLTYIVVLLFLSSLSSLYTINGVKRIRTTKFSFLLQSSYSEKKNFAKVVQGGTR